MTDTNENKPPKLEENIDVTPITTKEIVELCKYCPHSFVKGEEEKALAWQYMASGLEAHSKRLECKLDAIESYRKLTTGEIELLNKALQAAYLEQDRYQAISIEQWKDINDLKKQLAAAKEECEEAWKLYHVAIKEIEEYKATMKALMEEAQ